MSHNDEELRSLASWLPGLERLEHVNREISATWEHLKNLRRQAADVKAELVASCPLQLDETEFRFWTKVAIVDDDDSCWEWQGSRHPLPNNYGSFRWNHPVTRVSVTSPSSVVALFLTDGCLPANQGNHHCDNPPCSRPKHLYDGTHQENMGDRKARGRGWRARQAPGASVRARKPHVPADARLKGPRPQAGELNSTAKLTDELVIMARDLARSGSTLPQTHAAIGSPVSPAVLRWAITGRTWKHLDAACPPVIKQQSGSAIKGKKVTHRPPVTRLLTDDQVREIRRARDEADPSYEYVKSLAERFGVTTGMISAIARRRSYAHVPD